MSFHSQPPLEDRVRKHKTGVFFDGNPNELLPDELDYVPSSQMFLLTTIAPMFFIFTGSLAHISLV